MSDPNSANRNEPRRPRPGDIDTTTAQRSTDIPRRSARLQGQVAEHAGLDSRFPLRW